MSYNYLESRNRIDNILSSETLVIKKIKFHLPMMNLRILMESRHG